MLRISLKQVTARFYTSNFLKTYDIRISNCVSICSSEDWMDIERLFKMSLRKKAHFFRDF